MQIRKRKLTVLLAVIIMVGALWLANREVSPKTATRQNVQAEAENGGYRIIAAAGPDSTLSQPETPGPLYGWAMMWALLGVFAGGMALNLTPCIYPLIPITVSYFAGQASRAGQNRVALIAHGAVYILGLAFTNSLLGVVAALTGGLMGALLQSSVVLIAVGALLLFFAASLFGLWELRLPRSLTRAVSKNYAGYFGTLFMGLTLGVVAAPCIGPFVLSLLTWVAGVGSPWFGFLVFFTLSLGLGLPLFLIAMFSAQIERLPQSGAWMIWVRKLMGWVLVGMAVYFVRPVFPQAWSTPLLALVILGAGLHLGWIDRGQTGVRFFRWIRGGVAVASIFLGALLITSWATKEPAGFAWEPYSEELLQEAKMLKKPVIIDFYAAWCPPCLKLEEVTFRDPSVVNKAASHFVMIKVDLTKGGEDFEEQLLEKYEVRGVPTIVFLDRNGEERHDLRLMDFLPPDQFLGRMAEVKTTGG